MSFFERVLPTLDAILADITMGAAVVLLVISSFDSNLLKTIPMQAILATLAIAFVLTAAHIERGLRQTTNAYRDMKGETIGLMTSLQTKVEVLENAQAEFVRTLRPVIGCYPLAEAFHVAGMKLGKRIEELRVFAISSQQILSFVKHQEFTINRCTLLVRAFSPRDKQHADFQGQIKLVVSDWRRLQQAGVVGELHIRSYDFFPTEYECIFDDSLLVLGLYESDPDDYSEVKVLPPTVVDGSSPAGRQMIELYRTRFDKLFETCAGHHGANPYSARTLSE